MRVRDFFARANRLQQGRMFKIIATCVIALAAIGGMVAFMINLHAHDTPLVIAPETAPGEQPDEVGIQAANLLNNVLSARLDPTSVGIGIAILAGLCIGVVWLGLALTYLGLGVCVCVVVLMTHFLPLGKDTPALLIGIALLTATFTALMRLLAMLFAAPHPVFAIARNLLSEAVRMKISLVFIVLLLFGLAALPALLDEKAFLRYRVQSLLQWGTSGSFWLIAVLVLTFSVSSVTFEQRDKVIWQTMTKPVAPWQYLLGKWLGVVGLAAVLLGVSASGVFMFTEYLRRQPAEGEVAAYVAQNQNDISEDRFLLETQVLAARVTRQADPPNFDREQFAKNIEDRVQQEIERLRNSGENPVDIEFNIDRLRASIEKDLPKAAMLQFRSIAPGQQRVYEFTGLQQAVKTGGPVMLRFKIQAGNNMPDELYQITVFVQSEQEPRYLETPLNQFIPFRPPMLPSSIDADGVLRVQFWNGEVQPTANNNVMFRRVNAETMSFPADGLELSYSDGGYRANFFRCIGVLWVKLAFLAMLAICASTFLSFPVACLVAFTIFLAAEGSGFILESLESYTTETVEGHTIIFNTLVSWIAKGIASAFTVYSDLRPTGRLVEGLRLSWTQVGFGTGVLTAATAFLFGLATLIFRRRELATYSGQ